MSNQTNANDNVACPDEKLRAEICDAMSEHKRRLRKAYVDDLVSGKLTISDMVGIPAEIVKTAVVKLKF